MTIPFLSGKIGLRTLLALFLLGAAPLSLSACGEGGDGAGGGGAEEPIAPDPTAQ